ncbi:predicted protein [Nematostella vectensis]|uniref:PID domain-containing protein n=1 Tax=Nematostella vectensis TaxID=45351 RepID=A7RT00_NEMVE|nr:WASH complex subunit 2 [Nematostella vectensis]EDO45363.1 predicted protein [Nematostella vectensis]|eukprot:XP_001637426.1 predicted protein [Nematostella vectensis]
MSSAEKSGKTKIKKGPPAKSKPSTPKGKDAPLNEEKFRGDGVHFKCKLLGLKEVSGPRGDTICIDAIKKLKQQIKQTGEHKQKIIMAVNLRGIRILDEKSKALVYEHAINKVSFITHDPEDKKIFGYVCSQATGHMLYAIKYDKVAGVITATLYELFQVVFKLRQEAAQRRNAQNDVSQAVTNGPNNATAQMDTNIYEEPARSTPDTPSSAEKAPDAHYKVPSSRPLPPAPYGSAKQDQQETEITNSQAPDTPTSLTFASDSLFGTAVINQGENAAETESLSSMDMIRKGSISSQSSDTRSVDSKTSAGQVIASEAASTPPINKAKDEQVVLKTAGFHTSFEEEPNYETIQPGDYETIPNFPAKETKAKKIVDFNKFSESDNGDVNLDGIEDAKSSNPSGNESGFARFDNNDMFASFSDGFGTPNSAHHTPKDDPVAPSASEESKDTLASINAFESEFGSDEFSKSVPSQEKQKDDLGTPKEEDSKAEQFHLSWSTAFDDEPDEKIETQKLDSGAVSFRWDDAFGSSVNQAEATQDWTQAVKEGEVSEETKTAMSFDWDDAFGIGSAEEKIDGAVEGKQLSDAVTNATDDVQATLEGNDQKVISADKLEGSESVPWDAFGQEERRLPDTAEQKDTKEQVLKQGLTLDLSWGSAFVDKETTKQDKQKPKEDNKMENVSKPLSDLDFSLSSAFGEKVTEKHEKPKLEYSNGNKAVKIETDSKEKQDVEISWSNAFGDEANKQDAEEVKIEPDTPLDNAFRENDLGDVKSNKPEEAFTWKAAFGVAENKSASEDGANTQNAFGEGWGAFDSENKKGKDRQNDTNIFANFGSLQPDIFQPNNNVHKAPVAANDESSDADKLGLDPDSTKKPTEPIYINRKSLSSPEPESAVELSRPDSLTMEAPTTKTDRPLSPSAPPPLPPRPVGAPPSLPPRPRTRPLPPKSDTPPPPPRPAADESQEMSRTRGPKDGRKPPPPPPPRVDLEGAVVGDTSAPPSAVASIPNTWETSADTTGTGNKSTTSPDPFGDDFFTDFSFSAKESVKTNNTNQEKFLSDPFADKNGENDAFAAFGSDTFEAFGSSTDKQDSGFSGIPTMDPFSDTSDPFADKAVMEDPFAVNVKDAEFKTNAFQLNEDPFNEEDSFA